MVRYFVYSSLVAGAFVYSATGGNPGRPVDLQIAAGITCVLWLLCRGVRCVFISFSGAR